MALLKDNKQQSCKQNP